MKKFIIALMLVFVAPCYAGDYSNGVTLWAWTYICEKRNYMSVEESGDMQQWIYKYLVETQGYTQKDRDKLAYMVNRRIDQYEMYPEEKIKSVCAYMQTEARSHPGGK